MKNGLKWLLLLGGGYFLVSKTTLLCPVIGNCAPAAGAAPPAPATGGPQPGATPGVTPAPVSPAPVAASNFQFMLNSAKAGGVTDPGTAMLTSDQWCYYWNSTFPGTPCPDPTSVFSAARSVPMTAAQWWAGMTTKGGLSGLAARLSGLGCYASKRLGCYPEVIGLAARTARMG